MAGPCPCPGPGPSLPGVFEVLGAAGPDRLVRLKHRLRGLRAGCRGADLLLAMVLLQLGQDAEARLALDALKADAAARLVARQWAGVGDAQVPDEPPDVPWAVARLYHLLAQEELCPASLRDEAYLAALRGLRPEDPRLAELQAEARDRCGWGILGDPGAFPTLRSHLGTLPPSPASGLGPRSLPRPIDHLSGWSRGCSLRSTGSPASLASALEISQSPTVALGSPQRGPRETPAGPGPGPGGCQEPEEMSWPPSVDTAGPLGQPGSPAPGTPEGASDPASPGLPDSPTEASGHRPADPKPRPSPTAEHGQASHADREQAPPREPTDGAPNQSAKPGPPGPPSAKASPPPARPPPPASPAPGPGPGPAPLAPAQKFYSFVVLHARADEHVALRVRERLEALGVPDGATFCEDFQVPGRGELRCLQDAIDHAGFTVLLLTPSFDCARSLHQVSQALVGSFGRHGRQDCVVPFLPRESSPAQLSGSDLAGLLAGLVWLDEHSPIFARKVANTFRPQRLRALRAHWSREQEARALRERARGLEAERRQAEALRAAHATYLRSHWAWQAQMQALQAAFGAQLSCGGQAPPGQGPLGGPPAFPGPPGCSPAPPTYPPACPHPPESPQAPVSPHLPPSPHPPESPQAPVSPYPPPSPHPSESPQVPVSPYLPPSPQAPVSPYPPPSPQAPVSPYPPPSPGLQPLIIHHAQMVQLGLSNHMCSPRAARAPEDDPQGAE